MLFFFVFLFLCIKSFGGLFTPLCFFDGGLEETDSEKGGGGNKEGEKDLSGEKDGKSV